MGDEIPTKNCPSLMIRMAMGGWLWYAHMTCPQRMCMNVWKKYACWLTFKNGSDKDDKDNRKKKPVHKMGVSLSEFHVLVLACKQLILLHYAVLLRKLNNSVCTHALRTVQPTDSHSFPDSFRWRDRSNLSNNQRRSMCKILSNRVTKCLPRQLRVVYE